MERRGSRRRTAENPTLTKRRNSHRVAKAAFGVAAFFAAGHAEAAVAADNSTATAVQLINTANGFAQESTPAASRPAARTPEASAPVVAPVTPKPEKVASATPTFETKAEPKASAPVVVESRKAPAAPVVEAPAVAPDPEPVAAPAPRRSEKQASAAIPAPAEVIDETPAVTGKQVSAAPSFEAPAAAPDPVVVSAPADVRPDVEPAPLNQAPAAPAILVDTPESTVPQPPQVNETAAENRRQLEEAKKVTREFVTFEEPIVLSDPNTVNGQYERAVLQNVTENFVAQGRIPRTDAPNNINNNYDNNYSHTPYAHVPEIHNIINDKLGQYIKGYDNKHKVDVHPVIPPDDCEIVPPPPPPPVIDCDEVVVTPPVVIVTPPHHETPPPVVIVKPPHKVKPPVIVDVNVNVDVKVDQVVNVVTPAPVIHDVFVPTPVQQVSYYSPAPRVVSHVSAPTGENKLAETGVNVIEAMGAAAASILIGLVLMELTKKKTAKGDKEDPQLTEDERILTAEKDRLMAELKTAEAKKTKSQIDKPVLANA